MKVLIDIPEKTVEAVKAVMVSQCENENQEIEVKQTCDKLLTEEEPIPLDFDKAKALFENDPDKELLIQQINTLYASVTMLLIMQKDLDELGDR